MIYWQIHLGGNYVGGLTFPEGQRPLVGQVFLLGPSVNFHGMSADILCFCREVSDAAPFAYFEPVP